MKKRNIFITLGLALGLGVAGVAGLAQGKEAVEVDAAFSGTITIDTTAGSWGSNEGGQNFSVYFYNDSTGEKGWGSYVYGGQNVTVVQVSYTVNFNPEGMIAVRYSNWYSQEKWETSPWAEGDLSWGKWNQTVNLSYQDNANIVIGGWNDTVSKNNAYVGYPTLRYKGSDTEWKYIDKNFSDFKINDSTHPEYYGTYKLKKYSEFYVLSSGDKEYGEASFSLGTFESSLFIAKGNWEQVPGTSEYEQPIQYIGEDEVYASIYYDRGSKSFYINDPVAADADEWAQDFNKNGCTTTSTGTKAIWGNMADRYDALANQYGESFTNLFVNAAHYEHDDNTVKGYINLAVQRYDYVLERYGVNDANTDALGYEDFMGRVAANKVTPKTISYFGDTGLENNTTFNSFVIIAISAMALVTVGGVFLLRRKEN